MVEFLPAVYDWIWTIGAVAFVAVLIFALGQINGSMVLSSKAQLIWTLVVVCMPGLGLIAWFVLKPTEPTRAGR